MTPTTEIYGALLAAVRALDQELFNDVVGRVVLTLRAPPLAVGMAVEPGWLHIGDGSTVPELRLNTDRLVELSTLPQSVEERYPAGPTENLGSSAAQDRGRYGTMTV